MMEKLKKLNATGRIAIVVMVFLLVLISILGGRAIWIRLRGLDGLRPVEAPPVVESENIPAEGEHSVNPTEYAPVQALDITPPPTPVGWERKVDEITGNDYLAPPPEIEAEIREAFDAVMAVEVISDRSDAEALAYDREAAMEKMLSLAAPHVATEYTRFDRFEIYLADLGPEHPVYCENFERCTLGRVLAAPIRTGIVYDTEMCRDYKDWWDGAPLSEDGSRCVALGVDDAQAKRYIYGAAVELHNDGVWRVVEFEAQPLR